MRRLSLVALLLAASSCGGGSADEAISRWQSETDATCRDAQERIAERGRPARVRDLRPAIAAALEDVRNAIDEIAARPIPPESEARLRPFVDALEALEPRLERLFVARDFVTDNWSATEVDKIHPPLAAISRNARRAGLRICAPDDFAADVVELLHTPRFLEGLERAQRRFSAVIDRLRVPYGSRSRRFWFFRSLSEDFDAAYGALDGLYPPEGASKPLTDAMDTIQAASDLAEGLSAATINGERISPYKMQAAFRTHAHRLAAAIARARASVPAD